MPDCIAVFFNQKPVTVKSEQMGCYYFNILQAVELCKSWNACIVPPKFPLCPRDNVLVELYKHEPWDASILAIGSLNSAEVLDYSACKTLTFDEFVTQSGNKVRMKTETLNIDGEQFTLDSASQYWILDIPPRWDLQGHDPMIFYTKLYKTLPIRLHQDTLSKWNHIVSRTFLGVHWRRGDRGNITMGNIGNRLWKSTEPDKVAKDINIILEQNPTIEIVYISTNSGSKIDKRALEMLVNAPLFFLEKPLNIPPLDLWKWDILDLCICSKAHHILLSPGGLQNSSAFGRLLYAEALNKNPKITVSSMPYV